MNKPQKKIKVIIGPSTFAAMDNAPLQKLMGKGCDVINNPYGRKLTKEELLNMLPGVDGIIAGLETLDKDVLEKSALKVISRCGSGMSNVDLTTANRLGIKVFSTPNGPTNAVAELTIGAMFNLLRMITVMDRNMHEGTWTKMIGRQLEGRTVAIIGFGRIGKKVASLLKPFNVRLIAIDCNAKEKMLGVEFLPLEKAIREADILTLHSSGEQCLLGEKEFGLMKQGTLLLNAARGELIDEVQLINALESGKIGGAWLDVFHEEPYNGPLRKYSQVILTPHVGSYTVECRRLMENESVENLIKAFNA